MSTLPIGPNQVGIFHYTLTDAEGVTIESSAGRDPMVYLHGGGTLVPGLEEAMVGKNAGDSFSVEIPPAKGFGELSGVDPVRVKRSELARGVDWDVGVPMPIENKDGTQTVLWVSKSQGAWVWLTRDHPLAGKTLNFDVRIVEVRPATSEETAHGHAHGHDGHAHH